MGIYEYKGYPTRLGPPVDPGMIVAALNDDITSFEMDFIFVNQHIDFATHDNRIVDRMGYMHAGMAGVIMLLCADLGQIFKFLGRPVFALRGKFDHPEN